MINVFNFGRSLKDLVDDLMSFVKDRYFLGEMVLVNNQSTSSSEASKDKPSSKIIDIIIPIAQQQQTSLLQSSNEKTSNAENIQDEIIDVEMTCDSSTNEPIQTVKNGLLIGENSLFVVMHFTFAFF